MPLVPAGERIGEDERERSRRSRMPADRTMTKYFDNRSIGKVRSGTRHRRIKQPTATTRLALSEARMLTTMPGAAEALRTDAACPTNSKTSLPTLRFSTLAASTRRPDI